jgi:hypothetical protein
MESEAQQFKPPYGIAWRTFVNFLDRIAELEREGAAPPRIDRSFLTGLSGNDQSYLMSALRGFGLLGPAPENKVEPTLIELATDLEGRPVRVANLLKRYYPQVIELAEKKETPAKLEETFRSYGLSGETMRKAITWYMHAALFAGLPLSPHWATPKPARGGTTPGSRRGKKGAKKPANDGETNGGNGGGTVTDSSPSRTVTLASGGHVRLSYAVNLFEVSAEDRQFVLGLIDTMNAYEAELPSSGAEIPEELVAADEGGEP